MKFLPLLLCLLTSAQADESIRSKTRQLVELTGDEEFSDPQSAWDKTYQRKDFVFGKEPVQLLADYVDQLPKGKALDIASGEGRNAVFLAKKGFQVDAVDISNVGLIKAQKLAKENKVHIRTINADLNKYKIRPKSYDVIVNFYYLQRNLIPEIKAGLKRGGIILFETNTIDQLKIKSSVNWERDFLLLPGELKQSFSQGFTILHYSETNDGKNAIASLIARKN